MSTAVVVDTEWGFRDGRTDRESAFEPAVLCAQVDGERHHFLGRDSRLALFVNAHRDRVWVAHNAVAEMKYLLRMGIELPARWFDTMVAFRAITNRPDGPKVSLVNALAVHHLHHLIPDEKEAIRNSILSLSFKDADLSTIVNYCHQDVTATFALYEKVGGKLDPVAMEFWIEYLKAVSRIELRGIPLDLPLLDRILRNRLSLQAAQRAEINKTVKIYRDDGSFNKKVFFRWVARQGIDWPLEYGSTGRLHRSIKDETLEEMESHHPFIAKFREARKTLASLTKFGITLDRFTRRHYYSLIPFRSVTGRNQPKRFLFGGPKWLRFLAVPPTPDHVLVSVDFSAQEIGIAAALSGDSAMREMYAANDPHIAFAIMAGAAPVGATQGTHRQIRKVYKTVNLAVLYGQTTRGVATRLKISEDEASELLRKHRQLFRVYHSWSDRVAEIAYSRGFAISPGGWRSLVPLESKWRTWANFPIQATGADIMRVMTIALDRQKVETLAIIHDGWLLACRREDRERVREAIEVARQIACEKVVKGFHLKLDIAEYAERYEDGDGQESWDFISSRLPKEDLRVDPE